MLNGVTDSIKAWLISLFASAVASSSRAEDRVAAVRWLGQSRDILASDLQAFDKARKLNALIDSRAVAGAVARGVADSVKNYRHANLPWAVKVAIPATLAAIPLVGAQGAGVAAFGGAIGVPVLLLIFLGAAGVTSIIEAVVTSPEARPDIAAIIDIIVEDERLRRVSREMKEAMRSQPAHAKRHPMPPDEIALHEHLLAMDPFDFEQHAVSFFEAAGLETTVTRKSNDLGADGFAVHPEGLIVVQCKRNAIANKVGRPTVQQFKGVIEEHGAFRGYVITTSTFTEEASASAQMLDKLVLIDGPELVKWHAAPPSFHKPPQ